jgi:hypothetical protein|tara:strand:+ start:3070 stop:3366 length:297 start_codon:yes stop_codon:yes gene_type:complete
MEIINENRKDVHVVFNMDELTRKIIPTLYRKQDEVSNKLAIYLQECVLQKVELLIDAIESLEDNIANKDELLTSTKNDVTELEQHLNEIKSIRAAEND